MSEPVFLHDWAGEGLAGMVEDFTRYSETPESEGFKQTQALRQQLPNMDIVLASYTYENYSGSAFVLFYDREQQGYFEVHGSHCSCYGLEGQWEPEPCSYASLMHRLDEGELGKDWKQNVFADELRAALKTQPGHRMLRWIDEGREVAA